MNFWSHFFYFVSGVCTVKPKNLTSKKPLHLKPTNFFFLKPRFFSSLNLWRCTNFTALNNRWDEPRGLSETGLVFEGLRYEDQYADCMLHCCLCLSWAYPAEMRGYISADRYFADICSFLRIRIGYGYQISKLIRIRIGYGYRFDGRRFFC